MPPLKSLPEPSPLEPADLPLYDALRAWRRRLAAGRGIPPYIILHNRTLAELARWRPADLQALREIRGIGEAKAAAYGPALLAVIADPDAVPDEDVLVRLTALLVAAAFEVRPDPEGGFKLRPTGGGPAFRLLPDPDLPEVAAS